MTRLSALLIPAILLAACGHSPEPDAVSAGVSAPVAAVETAKRVYEARPAALPFRLDITVSSEVIRALDAAGATLTVGADYYGEPRAGAAPVNLGHEDREISAGNKSITLAGRFDAAQVAREISGDPRVKVSAAVSQEGGPVVYCTEFEAALTLAVETGGFIHCELLSE
ncbi:putative lipoprotein [Hyphomonas neptunium ATCC 15444]|uniref:Putative lipoprotein n=2 Tax=Hyphomonas TaxID=85 RepID=Q0C503_HYPNA|nr:MULTISPECIES: hypothetical protein [Hyphomonas]ABI78291.1 putative lipoprotein [Hyphomonas neptunium ATCC 15444]KCZ95623.1 putative lipoprotein [Hyphomonas hirschiana VP5]